MRDLHKQFGNLKGEKLGYRDVLRHIEGAVRDGAMKAGYRLPPQRELAYELGVSVGTITRAYVEAERRGIVSAHVGRGTFITGALPGRTATDSGELTDGIIDFSHNRLPIEGYAREFFKALGSIANLTDAPMLLQLPEASSLRFRTSVAGWIRRTGLTVDPQNVIVCNSVQHGLAITLGALAKPGDVVLTEWLNYPGIRLFEKIYHLQLRGLPMDADGIDLEALEAACKRGRARFLLCQPTVHNPTTTTTSQSRRRKLAALVEKYDLTLIENDIYGFLPAEPILPISAHVPHRSCYVTGTSKTIGTGVRVGYVVAPSHLINELVMASHATAWIQSALMPEIVSSWILDGTIGSIINWHRREARRRQQIAETALDGLTYQSEPSSYHIWLHLPNGWRQDSFVTECRRQSIKITSSELFVIGKKAAPRAVRICLGLQSHAQLERGLSMLRRIMSAGPAFDPMTM